MTEAAVDGVRLAATAGEGKQAGRVGEIRRVREVKYGGSGR